MLKKRKKNNLKKLKGKKLSVEAILFGMAGFLKEPIDDSYYAKLLEEYTFLKLKYSFKEMNTAQWKFMRMRPANFPVIRIAQLAVILDQWGQLTEQLFYHTSSNKL